MQEVGALRTTTPLRTLSDLAADPYLPTEQFEHAVKVASSRGMISRSQADKLRSIRKAAIAPRRVRSMRA
jgi:hypothetical protein